jgi:gluconolactonase
VSLPDLAALEVVAEGLQRPEGICVAAGGALWLSSETGLLTRLGPAGERTDIGSGGVAPNGLALDHHERVLVADYGDGAGLLRFDPRIEAIDLRITVVDGLPVRRANHPAVDRAGLVWCTCSTLLEDDLAAVTEGVADGYIFVVDDEGSSRVVADGLRFANGLAFSPDGDWLYVAESGARQVSRARVSQDALGAFERFGPDLGAVPDGVAVDSTGAVWVTLVFQRNAVVRIEPSGEVTTVVEDVSGTVLRTPTNIAFGSDQTRSLYITSADSGRVLRMATDRVGVVLPPAPR